MSSTNRQTVSFSVARHAGHFKLGSKHAQLYHSLSILPLIHQATSVSSRIITPYVESFICLHFALLDTRVLNLLEELWITWVAAINSFTRVLNPQEWSICTVIHRQTVLLYHNSSVWLDTQDTSSWGWNLPIFMFDLVSYHLMLPVDILNIYIFNMATGNISLSN